MFYLKLWLNSMLFVIRIHFSCRQVVLISLTVEIRISYDDWLCMTVSCRLTDIVRQCHVVGLIKYDSVMSSIDW